MHNVEKHTGPPIYYAARSCLASDTHAVKLSAHSLCADVSARGGLELCSYCVNRALVTQRPCSLTAIRFCF